jgi:hypothetical protein
MGRSIVIAMLAIGLCCPVLRASDAKPRVVTGKDGMPALILPESLKAAMRKYNARMQLPQWRDYGAYADDYRGNDPHSVPWAAWGDFDGNGRTDVALYMHDAEYRIWKAVAYHQRRDGGWRAHLILEQRSAYPEKDDQCGWIDLTLRQQRLWYEASWDQKNNEPIMRRMWLRHDAIAAGCDTKGIDLYYWRVGRYHRVCVSSI